MEMRNNVILITGGGSGIGLGLALEFKRRGNEVIVAGRSASKLAAAAGHGLKTEAVDLGDAAATKAFGQTVVTKYPRLNVVIHAAGVMKNENLLRPALTRDVVEETITTNLLAPLRLNEELIPHLLKQPSATIMTVTSGLASVPLAMTPTRTRPPRPRFIPTDKVCATNFRTPRCA